MLKMRKTTFKKATFVVKVCRSFDSTQIWLDLLKLTLYMSQKKILHVKNTKIPSRNSGTLCIFQRRPFRTNFSFQSERYGPKLCSQKLVAHKSRYSRFFMQARFHNKSREIDQNRHKMAKIGFFHSKWGVKSPKKGRKHRKTSPKCSHTIWGSFGATFDFWSNIAKNR